MRSMLISLTIVSVFGILCARILAASSNVDFVGSWPFGGGASAVSVYGDKCYLGSNQGVYVLDISAPASPKRVGAVPTQGQVYGLCATAKSLYIADGEAGLRVIDTSSLKEVGYYRTPGYATAVSFWQNHAYIVASGDVHVLDVSDPCAPKEEKLYKTTNAQAVFVSEGTIYVADGQSGLLIIPAQGNWRSYDTPGYAEDVCVKGTLAYVADEAGGLRIIDVSNLESLKEKGFLAPSKSGYVERVATWSDYAFVLEDCYGMELRIVDVSAPSTPWEIASTSWAGSVGDILISENQLYVTNWPSGLSMFDVSHLPSLTSGFPPETGWFRTPGDAWVPFVYGHYAYVADYYAGLIIIDVNDPNAPHEVGNEVMYGSQWGGMPAHDVYVAQHPVNGQDYAYVAAGPAGLRVINVSKPSSPIEEGSYVTYGWARAVYVSGTYAYLAVADYGPGSLEIVDVSKPDSPKRVGYCNFPEEGEAVFVAGDFCYVGTVSYTPSSKGFHVVNVSKKTDPNEVGAFQANGTVSGIRVSGNYAYLTDVSGLHILDVSTPSVPIEKGFYDAQGGWFLRLFLSGTDAYVADTPYAGHPLGGVRVISVSNPSSPTEVGFCQTPGAAKGVFVSQGYAYVADGSYVLQILRYRPSQPGK